MGFFAAHPPVARASGGSMANMMWLVFAIGLISFCCSAEQTADGNTLYSDALCGFVASTDIQNHHPEWSCYQDGRPESDPCGISDTAVTPEKQWSGVKCNITESSGTITGLNMSHFHISGTIPSSLGDIETLTVLELENNCLTGTLPDEIYDLSRLQYLLLVRNNFTGSLPSKIGHLTGLVGLEFSSNNLTGSIPPELGELSLLESISLHDNNLSGEIPSSIGCLSLLQTLSLGSNYIKGVLPSELGGLLTLTYMDLKSNQLTGSIPTSLLHLSEIQNFDLADNSLTGVIATAVGCLESLVIFDVSHNFITGTLSSQVALCQKLVNLRVNDNKLTGSLPSSLGMLIMLTKLELESNCYSGTIPSSYGSLINLISFDTSDCYQLQSSIPASFGKLIAIRNFYMPYSGLTGTLPSSMCHLTHMNDLYLNGNSLTGTVPNCMGNLSQMLGLAIDSNSLSGSVPTSVWGITSMGEIDLSTNRFTGSIPSDISNGHLLLFLEIGDNFFSGTLPRWLGESAMLKFLILGSNDFSGSISNSLVEGNILAYMSIEHNKFTGRIPPRIGAGLMLDYLQVNNNYLTGPLEFLTDTALIASDLSFNQFNGTIPTLPDTMNSVNLAFSDVEGTIPSSIVSTNLHYLNLSNTLVMGSIPNELCSVTSFSIDVDNTGVNCYSGCLTSSEILIYGVTEDCHNGSIMRRFLLVCSIALACVFVSSVLYRGFSSAPGTWLNQAYVCVVNSCACRRSASASTSLNLSDVDSPSKHRVGSIIAMEMRALKSRVHSSVVWISFVKVLVVVVISLSFSDWWTYSGGSSVESNTHVVETCSNPVAGHCFSFCDETVVIDVTVVDDDFVIDVGVFPPDLIPSPHSAIAAEYCIANLEGYCAYNYWLIFKMVPLLLHALQFLLQCLTWWHYKTFTPQQRQYDTIIKHLFPDVAVLYEAKVAAGRPKSPASTATTTATLLDARREMLYECMQPPFYSIFAFIEVFTSTYVWGELAFPATYCGSVRPLSLYYYPILMSLADLVKFNIYVCIKLVFAQRYAAGIFALLSANLFFTNLWINIWLAGWFVVGIVIAMWTELKATYNSLVYCVAGSADGAWPSQPSAGRIIETSTANPIQDIDTKPAGTEEDLEYVESGGVALNNMVSVEHNCGTDGI